MLQATVEIAWLRQVSRGAIGTGSVTRGFDVESLLTLYSAQLQQTSNRSWKVEVPAELAQVARLADLESTYDRFLDHFLTYWELWVSQTSPSWTAITGYYTSFWAAQVLLTATGAAARGLRTVAALPRGLYVIDESPGSTPSQMSLAIRSVSAGSHQLTWKRLRQLVTNMTSVPGGTLRSKTLLGTFDQLIDGPPTVADFRNLVNYSIDITEAEVLPWTTELTSCGSRDELEERLLKTQPSHTAQRLELVTMVTATLLSDLYDDYINRAHRPDRRPLKRRQRRVAALPRADHPANVWF
jgi:hypothetical protein